MRNPHARLTRLPERWVPLPKSNTIDLGLDSLHGVHGVLHACSYGHWATHRCNRGVAEKGPHKVLINAVTGEVSTGPNMSAYWDLMRTYAEIVLNSASVCILVSFATGHETTD